MNRTYWSKCEICGKKISASYHFIKYCKKHRHGRVKPRTSRIIPGRTVYPLAGLIELPTNKFLEVVQRQIAGEDIIRGVLR